MYLKTIILCIYNFFFIFNFLILFFFFLTSALRASTSVDVNICKIQKVTNFTHFTQKRHKGGEVSRGLKKSTGIRFSLFFVLGMMWVLISASGLERRCGACDGCGVDGVLVMVLLGFDRERKRKKRKRKRQRGKKKKEE